MSQFDSSYFGSFLPGMLGGQSQSPISAYGAQYGQLRSFQPNMNIGFGHPNIPGLGQTGNSLLNILPMVAAPMFQQHGYTIGNLFAPLNSMREATIARSEYSQMLAAEGFARQQNESIMSARLRSIDTLSGRLRPDADNYYKNAAQNYNQMITAASPFIGMADQIFGTDFLGTLMPTRNVGINMAMASKGFYRGSGIFGLQNAEVNALTQGLIENFKGANGDIDYSKTAGLSLSVLSKGAITLQNMGLMGGYMNADQFKASGLVSASDPNLEEIRNKYNSNQISKQLQSYSGVFALAKEITGSKDTDEMIKAVQALSGGAAGQMDPGRLQNMLSQTREIARTARMSMDVMSAIINESAGLAKSMGMSSQMGARLATQNVLLANTAIQAMGGVGPQEFAGKVSFEGVYQTAQQMSLMGAGSRTGMTVAAAMHMLGQAVGGAGNVFNANGSVNTNAVTDPLLQKLAGAVASGDPGAVAEISKFLRTNGGEAALAKALSGQSGGSLSFQSARGGLYDETFSRLGQTEFDLGNFNRGAQRGELVDLMTYNLSHLQQQKAAFKALGLDVGAKGLRALANAAIAPSQFGVQQNIAKLLGKDFNKLSPEEQAAIRGAAIALQGAEDDTLRQQGISLGRNEVNAVLTAQDKMREVEENIRIQGNAANNFLGLGTAEFPARLAAVMQAIRSGSGDEAVDLFLQSAGFIKNDAIRKRMESTAIEAANLGRDLAAIDRGEKVDGYDSKDKIDYARGRLNRLLNVLSDVPSEMTKQKSAQMEDFGNAAAEIRKNLANGVYKTKAEKDKAMERLGIFEGVAKKGTLDPSTDHAAIIAYSVYNEEKEEAEEGTKLKQQHADMEARKKELTEKRDAAKAAADRGDVAAKQSYNYYNRRLQEVSDAADTKNKKGSQSTAKADDKPTKVEIINPTKDMKLAGTVALTMDKGQMKAMLDLIQKEERRA